VSKNGKLITLLFLTMVSDPDEVDMSSSEKLLGKYDRLENDISYVTGAESAKGALRWRTFAAVSLALLLLSFACNVIQYYGIPRGLPIVPYMYCKKSLSSKPPDH